MVCSFFGAIPGAGATMRTVVNMKNGATTRISGVTHAIVLLIIALFLAPIASKIPLALLAGILIKVGFDILDYRFLQIIQKVSKDDLIIMITVFLLTVFVDLIMAVAAGVFISSFMAVYQISKNIKNQTQNQKIPKIIQKINKTKFKLINRAKLTRKAKTSWVQKN